MPRGLDFETFAYFDSGLVETYFDTDIVVLERLKCDNVTRVFIPKTGSEQKTMVCKVGTCELTAAATFRELQCLTRVAATSPATLNLATTALSRVPRLLCIVRSSAHGGAIGFVEAFIPHTHAGKSSKEGESNTNNSMRCRRTLHHMDLTAVSISRQEEWNRQITETVTALRQIGVTCGNPTAEDVLINSITDEAWLINFR